MLRTVAKGGPLARAGRRSSCQVTSRTQCTRFSIVQCPRSPCANVAGPAAAGGTLVIQVHVSTERHFGSPIRRRARRLQPPCCTPGHPYSCCR